MCRIRFIVPRSLTTRNKNTRNIYFWIRYVDPHLLLPQVTEGGTSVFGYGTLTPYLCPQVT